MSLSYPPLLILGLLVAAALIVGAVLAGRRRSAALAAAGVSVSGRRTNQLGLWLSVGGVVLLAVAVAGPAAALPVGRSAGTVILAMDVSNSMSADDATPSRLAAAQQAALSFIDAQPDSVDIGVVGFDQGALTTSQPSADRAAVKAAVQRLRTAGGTSLASAILGSLSAITGTPVRIGEDGDLPDIGYWGSATIVLFSDGEDQGGTGGSDAVSAAATIAQNAGVHIEAVGVGTADGTTVEIDGYQVHTSMETEQWTAIAQATGDTYHRASESEQLVDAESAQRSGYAADVIVVLTDGANTQGVEPAEAAESAAVRGLRVFTIGFGTTTPTRMACTGRQAGGWAAGGPGGGFGGRGGRSPRVIDEATLQAVAEITGGQYYKAESADQLQEALGDLPSQVTVVKKHIDIASWFAGAGGLLVAVAVGLSLWWSRVRAPR